MNKNYLSFLVALIAVFNISAQEYIAGVAAGDNLAPASAVPMDCSTIFSFQTTDVNPSALAFDGTLFYSAGSGANLIYKYNLAGEMVGTIPHPGGFNSGGDIDFDGTNLWVISEQLAKLYKINPSNGTVLSSFTLPSSTSGGDPNNYGCAYDDGYIWSTEYIDQSLVKIKASTGQIIATFTTAHRILPLKIINGELFGIAFLNNLPDGPMQLERLDKTSGAIFESYPLCIQYALGMAYIDGNFWSLSGAIPYGTQSIYKFDASFLAVDKLSMEHSISIFPNPTTDYVTITAPENINSVAICDLLGKEVRVVKNINATTAHINMIGLENGIYFTKITANGKNYTEKILKN